MWPQCSDSVSLVGVSHLEGSEESLAIAKEFWELPLIFLGEEDTCSVLAILEPLNKDDLLSPPRPTEGTCQLEQAGEGIRM